MPAYARTVVLEKLTPEELTWLREAEEQISDLQITRRKLLQRAKERVASARVKAARNAEAQATEHRAA